MKISSACDRSLYRLPSILYLLTALRLDPSGAPHRASRDDRRPANQTAIATYTTQNKTVTATHVPIAGNPAASGRSDSAYRSRRSPARPYVSGLARMTQLSHRDSPAGKNAPESSHNGIRKTLMMA